MREPSRTVGERGYERRPPPLATWAVRGRGCAGEPRLSLYPGRGAGGVQKHHSHTHTHTGGLHRARRVARKIADMYISMRDGGFARVARCVLAMAPAALAHARPYSRVLAGHRKRDRVQLRVACVQCCLCKQCGCEQSWQHCASHGVRHACVLDDAQPVSIIPCVRARERGRHGLRRPGQRAGAQRACCFLVPPWFWGAFFSHV